MKKGYITINAYKPTFYLFVFMAIVGFFSSIILIPYFTHKDNKENKTDRNNDYEKVAVKVVFENGSLDTLYISSYNFLENGELKEYPNEINSVRTKAYGVKYVTEIPKTTIVIVPKEITDTIAVDTILY